METQTINAEEYIKKINKVETMLEEIKQGIFLFAQEFQESIKRGEKDIEEGRVAICKTKEDLDKFFSLI